MADTERYRLRDTTPADLDFMYEVKREALRDYVAAAFGSWDDEAQRDRFVKMYVPSADRIVVVDGRDVGTLSIDWSSDPVFIAGIYLRPEIRGRGLGRHILEETLARAHAEGRAVALRVLSTNPRARALYERLGFAVTGATDTHIELTRAAG